MRIIRVNTMPADPAAAFVAVDEFPDLEFRIDPAVHNTQDAVLQELRRRVLQERARRSPPEPATLQELRDLVNVDIPDLPGQTFEGRI